MNDLKAQVAKIYQTNSKQMRRWIEGRAPILVASRFVEHLMAQNNYGSTGSMLQTPKNVARIQRELDALFGDDLSASAIAIELFVEIDDAIKLLSETVQRSKLAEKIAMMKGVKALRAAIRSLDPIECTPSTLEIDAPA